MRSSSAFAAERTRSGQYELTQRWARTSSDAGHAGVRRKVHDPRGQLVSIVLFGTGKPPQSAARKQDRWSRGHLSGLGFPGTARRRILKEMVPQLEDRLAAAALSEAERNTVRRFVALMDEAVGEDLRGLWLYGSRARGEAPHQDSDVDLLVIAEGDRERQRRIAMDLSEAAAWAEGESPFTYSVHVFDLEWLRRRREIESFFIQEVDRDKVVLVGSALD